MRAIVVLLFCLVTSIMQINKLCQAYLPDARPENKLDNDHKNRALHEKCRCREVLRRL